MTSENAHVLHTNGDMIQKSESVNMSSVTEERRCWQTKQTE